MVKENIKTMLAFATDLDVILLSSHSQRQLFEWSPVDSSGFLTELNTTMRRSKPDWQMYRCAERVVLKSTQLIAPPPLHVPQLPVCQRPEGLPPIVVDVVFVSRNRPMQVRAEKLASFFAVGRSYAEIELGMSYTKSKREILSPRQVKLMDMLVHMPI